MIPLSPEHDSVAHDIVDSAFTVHRALGPGLLESVYERCLAYELHARGFKVEQQVNLPVVYREVRLEAGFRIDILVNDLVVIELKTVERLPPIHEAQLLTYLKLSGKRLGFQCSPDQRRYPPLGTMMPPWCLRVLVVQRN